MKERNCRKKIATLLSLMGFHDPDPETTIQIMCRKLFEIQEKNKKLSTNITKVTFKFKAKTLVQENTTNFFAVIVPKKKRSSIKRVANFRLKNVDNTKKDSRNVIIYDNVKNNDNVMELSNFITNMGGSEVELVFEKRLTASDVAKNHGRLLIPVLKVKNPGFLTSDEKTKLGNEENISVLVFDPERRKLILNLGQWNMRTNENYVLKTQWNQLVSVNGFKENMVIQVLSFRVEKQLCFAIVRV